MRVTTTIYNYHCTICNKNLENAPRLIECVECGRLLCKEHFKKGLCPKCSQKLDYYVIESITKKIKTDNLLYLLKLLLIYLPTILLLLLLIFDNDKINSETFILIIGILGMALGITAPGVIPTLLIIRLTTKRQRHFKLTSKVLKLIDDLPVYEFFIITKFTSFIDREMEFNQQKREKIFIKFQKLVSWYGIDDMMLILAMHLKMRGVQNPHAIEKCLAPLIQAYQGK